MNTSEYFALKRGAKIISDEVGILSHVSKLPRYQADPRSMTFGVWPANTKALGGTKYSGRSSGSGRNWIDSMLGTVGETIERYCCAFYDRSKLIKSSYKDLDRPAIHPSEFALYHQKQYENINFPYIPFTEDVSIHWTPCIDLTNNTEVLYPGSMVFLPWIEEEDWVGLSISTGLAAHTDVHSAMLTALYEIIERDAFTIAWSQLLDVPKIKITPEIQRYIDEALPGNYEIHFLDVTTDLNVPSIFAFCYGQADYGSFLAVSSATRPTFGETLRKIVQELSQTIPYFRYVLGENWDWYPHTYDQLQDFEQHSILYNKRKDLRVVFEPWRNKPAEKYIDFHETNSETKVEQIRSILQNFKDRGYNVLMKDLTTPDAQQAGFYSLRLAVPQTIEMAGAYGEYFWGGKRMYEAPKNMGYTPRDFDNLNQYPYPFP